MHRKRKTRERTTFRHYYAQSALSIAEFNQIFPRTRLQTGTGIWACLPMWTNEIVDDFFCASVIPGIVFTFKCCLDRNFLIKFGNRAFCKNRVWFQFLAYLSNFESGNQEITGTGDTTKQLKRLEKKIIAAESATVSQKKVVIKFPML